MWLPFLTQHVVRSLATDLQSAIADAQMWLVYFKGQKALLCSTLYCQGRHSLLFLCITVPWNQRCSSISSSAISDPQMWLVYIFKGQKALLCPSLYCQGRHSLCYYFFVLQFLRTDSTLKFTVKIQILILLYNLRRL